MKKTFFSLLFILTSSLAFAQQLKQAKTRGLLQQEFIISKFITPQINKKSPVKISKTADMDSLFTTIERAWQKAAPDTLKKYRISMPIGDFNNIDAYCYFWLLASITQDLNITDKWGEYLVNTYMIPALYKDFETIKKNPNLNNIKLIHSGTLGNTLSIGSTSSFQKQSFLSTYKVFTDFKNLVQHLPPTDTAVINYAEKQLKSIQRFHYDFNARYSFYNGDSEKAFNYLLTGLSVNNYPVGKAISFSKVMINYFNMMNDKDKSFALLNNLTIYTTSDNLNRDTLLNLYLKTDPLAGQVMFNNLQQKLTLSAFKKTEKKIQLPNAWNIIHQNITAETIKKAKYIFIDFWYTSCGPCLEEIPDLNKFYEEFKYREDVIFLSINTDYINGKNDENYVKKRSKELNINFPIVYDNEKTKFSEQLGITSFPSKIIINLQGEVITKTDNSPLSLSSFTTLIKELDTIKN